LNLNPEVQVQEFPFKVIPAGQGRMHVVSEEQLPHYDLHYEQ